MTRSKVLACLYLGFIVGALVAMYLIAFGLVAVLTGFLVVGVAMLAFAGLAWSLVEISDYSD